MRNDILTNSSLFVKIRFFSASSLGIWLAVVDHHIVRNFCIYEVNIRFFVVFLVRFEFSYIRNLCTIATGEKKNVCKQFHSLLSLPLGVWYDIFVWPTKFVNDMTKSAKSEIRVIGTSRVCRVNTILAHCFYEAVM